MPPMPSKNHQDGQRKQAPNTSDQSQRKPSVPNAWAKGSTNPITQRPAGVPTANGVTSTPSSKSSSQRPSLNSKDSTSSQMSTQMNFLLANLRGQPAVVHLRNGDQYSGIFSTIDLESPIPKYLLKMVKKTNSAHVNGASTGSSDGYVGNGPNYAMAFSTAEVVDLAAANVRLEKPHKGPAQNGSRFRTDGDISSGFTARERDLQRWDGGSEIRTNMSLESSGSDKPWDQFEANERLYGVKAEFDESLYTTSIDRSHPQFKEREAAAEQLAREIMDSSATNSHVAEERGLKAPEEDGDEESKYSGVRRDVSPLQVGGPNKYTPPARRPPSGQPTVPGAPVDPAIISASLVKPENSDKNRKENEQSKPKAPQSLKSPKREESGKSSAMSAGASKTPLERMLPNQTKPPIREGGATATVETDVLNHFRVFQATEKLRVQEHQRQAAKRDKVAKMNDLRKFSQNFKLHTPVPSDLVPILAKDKHKQDEIKEKALKQSQEQTPPAKQPEATPAPTVEQKAIKPAPRINHAPPTGPPERQPPRHRQSPNFSQSMRGADTRPQQPNMQRPGQHSPFVQRLTNQYPRQPNMHPMAQVDLRMPPTGPQSSALSGVTSPPVRSNLQYHPSKIPDFKPNPAAHTFQPGNSASSTSSPVQEPNHPRRGNIREGRRPVFPAKNRPDLTVGFDPVNIMLQQAIADERTQEFAEYGGIPQFFTSPTWDVPEAHKDRKYTDCFERSPMPSVSPHHHMMHQQQVPHQIPHQHQLQMHLQPGTPIQTGHTHTPHHTPRHAPVQPHLGPNTAPHYDDHRMQFSASTSAVHPSPRPIPPYIASYQGPQGPVQMYSQPMQGFSPGGGHPMNVRQVSSGHQFIPPSGPGMGGHAMASQQSSGPYMNQMNHQVPMYQGAVPNQSYPHHNGTMAPQASSSAFPSPRQPAPMMAHQGSQQGHHGPNMYMSPGQHPPHAYGQPPSGPMGQMHGRPPYGGPPSYNSSPHQSHHFPQQQPPRGTPSASYAQPAMQNHSMGGGPQAMPPNAGPPPMSVDGPNDAK